MLAQYRVNQKQTILNQELGLGSLIPKLVKPIISRPPQLLLNLFARLLFAAECIHSSLRNISQRTYGA
jgi:hypothetical protein